MTRKTLAEFEKDTYSEEFLGAVAMAHNAIRIELDRCRDRLRQDVEDYLSSELIAVLACGVPRGFSIVVFVEDNLGAGLMDIVEPNRIELRARARVFVVSDDIVVCCKDGCDKCYGTGMMRGSGIVFSME